MNAGALDHLWDFSLPAELEASQEWILSAMKSHGPVLVTLLWRILGSEEMVCDAYQETFLKLAHHEFQTKPRHVKSYLLKTASNVAVSMLRRQEVHKKYIENISHQTLAGENGLADFDHQQCCSELRKHVARLPEHLREVILLRDFAEMSYRQVGGVLNITPATARVYRCKAVQLLAIWLKDEQKNEK